MQKAPFDTIASIYDDQFTHTRTGYLQRQLVYLHLDKILQKNKTVRILELNCGTGADAIWLAQKGYEVLATDISQDMVETAKAKAKKLPSDIQQRLSFKTIAAEEVDQLTENGPFDLIFSNFGGLNCVSPANLRELAPKLEKILSPNGRLVLVLMSRFCWWETLYFLAKRNWKQAWRRRSKTAVDAPLAEGVTCPNMVLWTTNIVAAFSIYFSITTATADWNFSSSFLFGYCF